MAVDSRDKRASVVAVQPAAWLFPNPDGSLATVQDRRHIAQVYRASLSAATYILVQSVTIGVPNATATIGVPKATATITV